MSVHPSGKNSILPCHSSFNVAVAMSSRSSTIPPMLTRSWWAYTIPPNPMESRCRRVPSRRSRRPAKRECGPARSHAAVAGHRPAWLSHPLRSEDVNVPQAQSHGHGAGHVLVHVQLQAQRWRFRASSLCRNPGSETCFASMPALAVRSMISAST